MVKKCSLSYPSWMDEEVNSRRRTGPDSDDTSRSRWIQEAIQARLEAEDAGEWDTPEIDADRVELSGERPAVIDASG